MTARSLRRRAAELLARCAPRPCRCPPDPEPPSPESRGLVVVGYGREWSVKSQCWRCGGELLIQVREVVVDRAPKCGPTPEPACPFEEEPAP